MIQFNKNNLDKSNSPYLQQHKNNPIYWQEWSSEVLDYAKRNGKIVFLSIGYATCHWCHVMAKEAFSQQEIADYLNENFVSIKVDREQRSDIDHYMMSYIQETQGQGGWPLNVFLTPDGKPFLALTYVPVLPSYGLPGFLGLLYEVKKNYSEYPGKIPAYQLHVHQEESFKELEMIRTIKQHFTGSGFGLGPQFPPHNTLLFLLYYYENSKDKEVKEILEAFLESIANRGLHDHLQGGFYRYCVDDRWTIPHFEKMLYDQAMLLWVYSLAYKILKKQDYKIIAEKIISCLEETYRDFSSEGSHLDSLYSAAYDADTEHDEGRTYLWTKKELQQYLTSEEYQDFNDLYILEPNFEGRIHLIKKKDGFLPTIEQKLLSIRQQQPQPFRDRKYITSWNALLGIAFLVSFRSLGIEELKEKADVLFNNILQKHYREGILYHSSYQDKLQQGEFLEDYASMLLLATYLYEETGKYKNFITIFNEKVKSFTSGFKDSKINQRNVWIENKTADFPDILAKTFDHPSPSSTSLAEMALFRSSLILEGEYGSYQYQSPLQYDFYNLMVSMRNGYWHLIHTPNLIDWKDLPANSMQIYSSKMMDCYRQKCVEFKTKGELLSSLKDY